MWQYKTVFCASINNLTANIIILLYYLHKVVFFFKEICISTKYPMFIYTCKHNIEQQIINVFCTHTTPYKLHKVGLLPINCHDNGSLMC